MKKEADDIAPVKPPGTSFAVSHMMDESTKPSTWKSEYDSRCQQLRLEMEALNLAAQPVAGKPSEKDSYRPLCFAWLPPNEDVKPTAKLAGSTEYRDNFITLKKDFQV